MTKVFSRRVTLQAMGAGGLTLYLRPWSALAEVLPVAPAEGGKATGSRLDLAQISPIDRTLGDKAARQYFGDENPERAHKYLWGKASFLAGADKLTPQIAPLVVIGGGLSGLFSAYQLREHKPVILEQASRFGGNSKGQSWKGIDYSIGAAYFIEPDAGSEVDTFVRELGIHQLWQTKSDEDPVALNGTIYDKFWSGETAKAGEVGQFTTLGQYFRDVLEGEKQRYPDIPIPEGGEEMLDYINGLDQVSFKDHLVKIAGGHLHPHIETAIEHYCWSSLGGASSEISAAAGLNFYAAEFGNAVVLPGGNARVAEIVLEKLSGTLPPENIRTQALVLDVTVKDEGVSVIYVDGRGELHALLAKAVVMACPKFAAAKILNDIEPERLAAMQKLRYRSYLVANLLVRGVPAKHFYDLYLLGGGNLSGASALEASRKQKVTDVVLGTFAKKDKDHTVLTLYRGIPHDGARAELYPENSYERYRKEFEDQLTGSILALLKINKYNAVDLRVARWGHPLPLAATGLIANGTLAAVRKPFKDRVFFVEQDNWALPAFGTSLTEALTSASAVKAVLAT